MEAAARLALREDFDVNVFDAFCVCLVGDDEDIPSTGPGVSGIGGADCSGRFGGATSWWDRTDVFGGPDGEGGAGSESGTGSEAASNGPAEEEERTLAAAGSGPKTGSGLVRDLSGLAERTGLAGTAASPQYAALGAWLVELACELLDPAGGGSGGGGDTNGANKGGGAASAVGGAGSIHGIVDGEIGWLSSQSGGRHRRSGQSSVDRRVLLTNFAGNYNGVGGSKWRETADGRFRYFGGTVCRIRLWRYHGGALFKALQRCACLHNWGYCSGAPTLIS